LPTGSPRHLQSSSGITLVIATERQLSSSGDAAKNRRAQLKREGEGRGKAEMEAEEEEATEESGETAE